MNSFYNDEQILSYVIKYHSLGALISSRIGGGGKETGRGGGRNIYDAAPFKREPRICFVSAEIAAGGINNARAHGRNCS